MKFIVLTLAALATAAMADVGLYDYPGCAGNSRLYKTGAGNCYTLATMPPPLPDHVMERIYHQIFHLEMTPAEVAVDNSVSVTGVRKWRQNWELFSVPRPPACSAIGRPTTLTRAQEDLVMEYLNEHPSAYLDEVVWYIYDNFGQEP
nr:hypothetical protein B0A51_17666 [Rachicladosporium sp. CCFEE 5018]